MLGANDVMGVGDPRADLRAAFADVDGHLALFYDDRESQLRVAAAFAAAALARNRRCLYLFDDNGPDAVRTAFREAGVDPTDDALSLRPATEVYLGDGFDPDRMIAALDAAAAAAVEDGYDGLSVAGENTWCFHTEVDFDSIVDFEAQFDAHRRDLPVTTLCQYHLDRFDERSVATALRTHEHVVYREALCRNPYYVSPAEYDGETTNARLMLEQAYGLAQNREKLGRHRERLSVLNRILRHDIRNDLNVVLGTVDLIAEEADLDGDAADRLATVEHVAERLVDRAEKARYIQRTVADSGIETADLGAVIEDAVAAVREAHPEAAVTVEAPARPTVLADRHLRTALTELLTNAVRHQDCDAPSVTLRTVAGEDRTVTVEVSNPGPPLPEADRRALAEGVETPLEHAGGLGLWLVKWVVDNSRGRLTFPDGDDTCRIAVELRTT